MTDYYFAYGLDLDEFIMTNAFPSAKFFKFSVLKGFKLGFDHEGACTINPAKNSFVEGVLFEIDAQELPEPPEGLSKSKVDVLADNGLWVRAIVYFSVSTEDPKLPTEEYLLRVHKKYGDYGFEMKNLETALEDLISKRNESCF